MGSMRRHVATGRKNEIPVIRSFLQQFDNSIFQFHRRCLLKKRNRVNIAHDKSIIRTLLQCFHHINIITKMISLRTGLHHGIRTMSCISTVMEYDYKSLILYSIHNFFMYLEENSQQPSLDIKPAAGSASTTPCIPCFFNSKQ